MSMTLTRGGINPGFANAGIAELRSMQDYDAFSPIANESSPNITIAMKAHSSPRVDVVRTFQCHEIIHDRCSGSRRMTRLLARYVSQQNLRGGRLLS
jgi:hypothetical protein